MGGQSPDRDVMRGIRRSSTARRLAVGLAASLAIAACGGGDDEPATTSNGAASPAADSGDLLTDLEIFGALAGPSSPATVATFDSSGGSLQLGDGASVSVSEGALGAPTELRAQTVELDFGQFVDNPPTGKVYVLSTVDDVDLGEPVELVIPVPSASVRVTQAIDGEWNPVTVPDGDTTRISIPHFSTVSTAVIELSDSQPVPTGEDPSGEAPAIFLTACVGTVHHLLADSDRDEDRLIVDDGVTKLALRICTRALVDRLTPGGQRADLDCVNQRIGDDTSLQQAINACVSDDQSDDQAATDPAPPDDTVVVMEGEVTGGPAVDGSNAGPTVVTANELEFVLSFGDGVVTGEGIVDREIDGSNDNCIDRYISPLTFTFTGAFADEESTAAMGNFDWRVDEGRFVQFELEQLGDVECSGRTSFASGAGDWTAVWDADSGTFDGSLTIAGGLGTNTFELATTTVISSS